MSSGLDLDAEFAELDHGHRRENLIKSPLNYMGAKTESLPFILEHIPYRKVFVDVFGGSGAVTIARRSSQLDVFNDKHSGVSAFFIAIKTDFAALKHHIETMPHSREIFKWCQDNVDSAIHDVVLRGAMWYYIVQTSFAGRAAYWGRTTKPGAPVYKKLYSSIPNFFDISERFSKVQIENLDWRQILKDFDSEDTVFYLDPPYYDSNVYKHTMTKDEHTELCHRIHNLKGFAALSGYENDSYSKFQWTRKHSFTLRQNVATAATSSGSTMENHSHKIDRTTQRLECLWIKE